MLKIRGEGRIGKNCLVGIGFTSKMIKMFWNQIEVVVANNVNVLNATELFTFKKLTLCYVNFTSVKTNVKNAHTC